MSGSLADIQFTLPKRPALACVLGASDTWLSELEGSGVRIRGTGESADLVIAGRAQVAAAVRTGAPMILVDGPAAGSALRRAGYDVLTLFPVPSRRRPSLLIPVTPAAPGVYAIQTCVVTRSAGSAVRKRLAVVLLERRLIARLPHMMTIGLRHPGPPFAIKAATQLGLPVDADWFYAMRRNIERRRNMFYVFCPSESVPRWIVKLAPRPEYADSAAREERGLALAESLGGCIKARAPTHIGRFVTDGFHASVETAAVGLCLRDLLRSSAQRAEKLRAIEQVADWLLQVARQTAEPQDLDDQLRSDLREKVLPAWSRYACTSEVMARLSSVPAVFQHNDLWAGNVVVGPSDFKVVDWEAARVAGFPLFDLLQFLVDSLAFVDDARFSSLECQVDYFRRLFRGESFSSDLLFRWVRRAVEVSRLQPAEVGPLATLCWLERGYRPGSGGHDAPPEERPLKARRAHTWLQDPALGLNWNRWL